MILGSFGNSEEILGEHFLDIEVPPGAPDGVFAVMQVIAHEVDPFEAPDEWLPLETGIKTGARWTGIYYQKLGPKRSWSQTVNGETSYTMLVTDGIDDPDEIQWLKDNTGTGDLAVCGVADTETEDTTLAVFAYQTPLEGAADIKSDSRLLPAAKNLTGNDGLGVMFAGLYVQREPGETLPFEIRFFPMPAGSYPWVTQVVALNPRGNPEEIPASEPPVEG